jgi:Zn-dependent peptidase ImmA (M78 family)
VADIEAFPTPRLLRWARETSRLPLADVLEQAGVSAETLKAWENGTERPTVAQLRTLGRIYRRSFAVFFLPSVPADFTVPHDFRRPVGAPEALSADLAYELRTAHGRRDEALALAETLGEPPTVFNLSASRGDGIAANAQRIRDALGVLPAEQYGWRNHYQALRSWITAVEGLGVLVFQPETISPDDVRGFSIGASPFPVIALNGMESPRGRVFTLMHELVHLALRETGVCDLRESPRAGGYNAATEHFCNRVAAELLVPTAELLRHDLVRTAAADGEWSDAGIATVAADFHVSREVALLRLVEIGRASEALYKVKRPEFLAAYRRNKQRQGRSKGGPPPARMALRRVGRPFAELVLEAYSRDMVPTSHLPDYFGIRLKHLPNLYDELRHGVAP